MTDVFAAAQKVTATKKAGKKAEKARVEVTGLEQYAVLDALEKSIAALKEVAKAKFDQTQVREYFVEKGVATGKKPESFRGYEGNAEASVECRKRGANSPLNDEEIALLVSHNVPVAEIGETFFIINPKYVGDKRIAEALAKANLPEDVLQVYETPKKTVVSDETLDAVFATKKKEVVEALFKVVSTTAYKPVVTDFDPAEAMKAVAELV